MRIFYFLAFCLIIQCSKSKEPDPLLFDPLFYLQQNYLKFKINLDTLYYGINQRHPYYCFYFTDSCNTLFYIEKTQRVRNAVMDSILPTCTTGVDGRQTPSVSAFDRLVRRLSYQPDEIRKHRTQGRIPTHH